MGFPSRKWQEGLVLVGTVKNKYLARLAALTESSSGCELAEAAYDNEE